MVKFGQQADLSGDFPLREMLAEGVEQDSFDGVQLSIQLVLHLLQCQPVMEYSHPSRLFFTCYSANQTVMAYSRPSRLFFTCYSANQTAMAYSRPSRLFFTCYSTKQTSIGLRSTHLQDIPKATLTQCIYTQTSTGLPTFRTSPKLPFPSVHTHRPVQVYPPSGHPQSHPYPVYTQTSTGLPTFSTSPK